VIKRRELLLAASAGPWLSGCGHDPAPTLEGGWVGASAARGHRLRAPLPSGPAPGPLRRTEVLIVGGGIAGLACARALQRAGLSDFALLELEDESGGNSRGHQMGGMPCPLGAHYLPLPGPQAHEVSELLHDLGLARQELGRTVFDERHLCHSPQERLFYQGQWHEGLLPPAEDARCREQYRRFGARVAEISRLGFALPSRRAPWTAAHARLDAQRFADWLDAEGLDAAPLRWYLDYCCRDEYGADTRVVSAWAGLHYFASRHGFHAPGESEPGGERGGQVLTWPEGNAWLARRLAEDLGGRLQAGRTVLRVSPRRHEVELLAWNEAADAPERWVARQLVLATPLFVAQRLLDASAPALRAAVAQLQYAPWLVANLQLDAPLLPRLGAPAAWDSVVYGSETLGYVDAGHQRLDPTPGPTVLSAYRALPRAQRGALLGEPWAHWAERIVTDLQATHPDLPARLRRIDLARWGHAMSIPVPGLRGSAALAALHRPQGRLHFAHGDLAGYSVFEEAYTRGVAAAAQIVSISRS
jgi:monoamine oxidase